LDFDRLLGRFEKVFVVSALFLFSGGLLTILRQMTGASDVVSDYTQTDPVSQAIFLLVYGITTCLVFVWRKRFARVVVRDNLLWLLVGLVLLSIFWSVAPEITLRRSIAILGTTLLGVYVAMRFNIREQLQLLAWALGMGALLSLLFVLAFPAFGIMSGPAIRVPGGTFTGITADPNAGGWRGIYAHKNSFGRSMALSAWVFVLLALSEGRYRWVRWGGLGLSVILLLLSNSKTGLVLFLTLFLLVPLYRVTRWPYTLAAPVLIPVALLVGGAALWGVAHENTVLGLLNRDVTLTGRTELWPAIIDMIEKRPWLGYGYGAFWQGWEGPSSYVLLVAQFDPGSAHSGYLELLLSLGLLGTVVFALGFFRAVIRAVNWARLTKAREALWSDKLWPEGLWPLGYLSYMLLYNLTESAILTRNSITWVLYVTVVLSMWRNRVQRPRMLTTPAASGFRDRAVASRVRN
jgi:exopolysaccharide production protein ExoQ